jgi:heme oxygenase
VIEIAVLDRMRAETRLHHSVADADRLALAGRPPTVDGYFEYLLKMFGFEAPLETALAVAPLRGLDLSQRMKASTLADDLRALGFPPERLLNIPYCSFAPFRSTTEALAWLFVSEANRSSHQLFRTYISFQLPELASQSVAPKRTSREEWHQLGAMLDSAVSSGESAIEELTDCAAAAFDCQHRWFQPDSPSGSVMRAAQRSAEESIRRASEGLRKALRYDGDE